MEGESKVELSVGHNGHSAQDVQSSKGPTTILGPRNLSWLKLENKIAKSNLIICF